MRHPKYAERPAPAVAEREPPKTSALGGSRDKLTADNAARLINQYHAAERQHGDNMVLAEWLIEHAARARQVLDDFERDPFAFGQVEHEAELVAEAERLRLALLLHKQVRGAKR